MKRIKIIAIIILLIILLSSFMPTIALAVDEMENLTENNTIIEENSADKDYKNIEENSGNIKNKENIEHEKINNETIDKKEIEENNKNIVNKNEVVDKEVNEGTTVNQDKINNINQEVVLKQNIEKINERDIKVKYSSHIQDYGWEKEFSKTDGEISGTEGKSKRLEAIKIELGNSEVIPESAKIKYQVHVQDYGWMNWKQNGEIAGTEGQNRRIEAIKIKLEGLEEYSVIYRTHVQDIGWTKWKSDGEIVGTTGQDKRIEAIQIKIVKMPKVTINYTYNQEKNTVKAEIVSNKELSYINDSSWILRNDKLCYTKEFNENGSYNILVEDVDGVKSQLQVNIYQVNEPISMVKYSSHIQDYGWEKKYSKIDGNISGITGEEKRLEAIRILLGNSEEIPESAKIKYQVHVQDYGWMNWKQNGEIAGTQGESKRIEALKIQLEGMDDYSVIYRVHIQNIGWTDWSSNGEISGTIGQSKRIEAVQIKVIKGKYEKFELSVTDGQNVIKEYKKDGKRYIFVTKDMDISNLIINYKGNVLNSSYGMLNTQEKTITGDFTNMESFTLNLASGDIENISIIQSDVPALFVNLDNNVTQQTLNNGSKSTKYKASINITGADNEKYNISDDNIEIKGRGNTTWVMPKKPYQIKFSKKQNLFGIGKDKSKKWVLLANYYDPTLLKNKIMDDLCVNSGLSNIPNSKSVDLYINGEYVGNYLVCDKVEIGKGRVELNDDKGVLVELDNAYYNEEEYNFMSTYTGNHYTIKEFKNDDMSSAKKNSAMNSFQKSLENFDKKLFIDNANWSEISKLIDVESFAKFYLLNEFSKNRDTYFSSTYFYKDGENDVIHMGPIWDYDKDSFEGATHIDYSTNLTNHMSALYKYPEFAKIVNEIYENKLKQYFDKISVNEYANNIRKSSRINSIIWNSENKYNEKVTYLNKWVEGRKEYFNKRYSTIKPTVYYSTHIQNIGWENTKYKSEVSGTVGQSLKMEAIRIYATDSNNNVLPIEYETHVENIGWQGWKQNGTMSGTTGQSLRVEAIKIRLKDSSQYSIRYRVHVQDYGWMPWYYDGQVAGTTGQGLRIEAIQIELVKK